MATTLIPVPFHGATLYLIPHNDEPYTPMRPIVEGMGLDWSRQYRKLATSERWGVAQMTTPSAGGPQESLCLPVRKLPGWLMTIHPNKVRASMRETIIAYQNECDDVLWRYWREARIEAPFKPAPTPLIAQVDPALLREYRLINPWLTQAYLVALGITPAYVNELLDRAPVWSAHERLGDDPAPARGATDSGETI